MVRSWYTLIESQQVGSCTLDDLLDQSPFEFSSAEGSWPGPEGLSAWVSELRSDHPQVEYRLTNMSTTAVDQGTYRIRFGLDRRALDSDGVPHVARREQAWLIRFRSGALPLVLRIDDESQLVFPGTGPQIVCY